jgi:putative ATP-binding cassette transporter
VKKFASTTAAIWRLSVPYFRSEDRWPGRILLAGVIAVELSMVALQVILNLWYNWFYNTLQDHDWSGFVRSILFFCVLAAIYTVFTVYQLYLNQWLQIRWRRWMTQTYLRQWLSAANHYRMQLVGDAADNPDQRIADDLRLFVNYTLTLGTGLLNAIVSFGSFVVILWALSAQAPLHLFGQPLDIPGYLVWAAIIYAILGTALTHLIGWRLIPLNFQQQRFEADFRFNLVRTRENAEQIAALRGEAAERERHLGRFSPVIANWLAIMRRTKLVTFFTASYSQASIIFPYIVVSPAYFAGAMQLGGLMQTASAFKSVQDALSFFISSYRDIAEWRAITDRLSGFEEAIEAGRAVALAPPTVEVVQRSRAAFVADYPSRTPRISRRRAHSGHRAFRRRQIDTVSGHCRHLAVRLGTRHGAGGSQGHAGAAAPLLSGRTVGGGCRLSGESRHLRRRPYRRSVGRRRLVRTARTSPRRSTLEPHAVARRTTKTGKRTRAVARA